MPMTTPDLFDWILLRDWRRQLIPRLGTEPWLIVNDRVDDEGGIYCFLVPSDRVSHILSTYEGDLRNAAMPPAVWKQASGHEYWRFGTDDGTEPLIYVRDYYGIRPRHLELSEEYRHFHSLFSNSSTGKFLKILDDGQEEVVGSITEQQCKLRAREVRQFLAIKRMHLVVYFWIGRESSIAVADLPPNELHEHHKDDFTNYLYDVVEYHPSTKPHVQTLSRIVGKKVVSPLPLERCGIWPYEDRKEYESYIIGVDPEGRSVEHTCDPKALSNSRSAAPEAPSDLTPVFFRKRVLSNYYANPKKYSVGDGLVSCASIWSMSIDNNHPELVVAFLGDLGRNLPSSEQKHWRSHNVPPDGSGLSEVNYRRSVLGEWTDPQAPDLMFKAAYGRLGDAWEAHHQWPLFRQLPDADKHCLSALRQVTVDDQAEFDRQIGYLTKVLVEAINEEELGRRLSSKIGDEKGISKLERFLTSQGLKGIDDHIRVLRDLQAVRSTGAAHMKGEKYDKVAARLRIVENGFHGAFDDLLARGIDLLDWLREWCESRTKPA